MSIPANHERSRTILLSSIFILAFCLRLGSALTLWNRAPFSDELSYTIIAKNLAKTGSYALENNLPTVRRTPAYPLFLTPFAFFDKNPWGLARVAQALLDSTTIFFVFAIALRCFKDVALALSSAFFYAVHPVFIAYSVRLLSESIYFWLWGLAVFLLLSLFQDRLSIGKIIFSGLSLGCLILCRPVALYFPIFICVFSLLFHSWRTHGKILLVVSILSYLSIVPWLIRNRAQTGEWILASGGGVAYWIGSQPGQYPPWQQKTAELMITRTYLEADREFYKIVKSEYRKNLPLILLDLPRRFAHFWFTSHSSLFGIDQPVSSYLQNGGTVALSVRVLLWFFHLATLSLAAVSLWLRKNQWCLLETLAFSNFLYCSLHIFIDYGPNRYHLPAVMLLLPFAVFGATCLILPSARAKLSSHE